MKRLLRRLVPAPLLRFYHWSLALLAAIVLRFPSRELIVIGVTGTTGKSTVVNLIEYLLTGQGFAVGVSSTPRLGVAGKHWTNTAKMTMPGRFALQRLLRQMVSRGCRYAILETTSEGLAQYRALGIGVDIAVFTNLAPEHLESHGSFDAYRAAKGRLFAKLARRRKRLNGVRIPKLAVVNADDPQANYFLQFPADRRIAFRIQERATVDLPPDVTVLKAEAVRAGPDGVRFRLGKTVFTLPQPGLHTVANALAAIAVCSSQDISLEAMRTLLATAPTVPGRGEFIDAGQSFRVVVDYAHEPVSLAACYAAVKTLKPKRLLAVLGATGGGRDTAKRPLLGQIAGEQADCVFVTNEDPYDDDPQQIIDQVAAGALTAGKVSGRSLFTILDRRQAINLAFASAQPGDAVVITGKGNEPWMVVRHGKKVPWDDREVARELLGQIVPVDKPKGHEREITVNP